MDFCSICRGSITFFKRNGKVHTPHKHGPCIHRLYRNNESYTRPFQCKCGAEVFYYRSDNGGEAVFDALGPPWPKHQCYLRTDYPSLELRGFMPVRIDSLLEDSLKVRVSLFEPYRKLCLEVTTEVAYQLLHCYRDAPLLLESEKQEPKLPLVFHTILEKPIRPYSELKNQVEYTFEAKLLSGPSKIRSHRKTQ
ncbi:hypothetical protein SAMN05216175_10564 [Neptunomonas qingdaonensis]|uniref:Uncharacterized protein n=1 Tax=Neptunomonas qingdaonensis TaxID=1045558 RepID=A0A1I2QP19_9GAMM|nr:hypothetical protein SAMN05216175_10564 [Neptunomonas qingdaonensis]